MVEEKSILKTVLFRDFSKWDVKQFFMKQIKSSYPITFLSELLNEETEKKISECDKVFDENDQLLLDMIQEYANTINKKNYFPLGG